MEQAEVEDLSVVSQQGKEAVVSQACWNRTISSVKDVLPGRRSA